MKNRSRGIGHSLRLRHYERLKHNAFARIYMYIYVYIHSLVFSLEGRAWQEPEPRHVTGRARHTAFWVSSCG